MGAHEGLMLKTFKFLLRPTRKTDCSARPSDLALKLRVANETQTYNESRVSSFKVQEPGNSRVKLLNPCGSSHKLSL